MIPLGHSRNVLSGQMPNGEIWQTGFWCDEAPSTQAAAQTQATNLAGVLSGRWATTGSPSNFAASGTTCDKLTVYGYTDTTGHAATVAEAPITGFSPSGTQTMPDQAAIVTSLLTASAGRSARGRMYWPCTAPPGLTGGEISSAWIDNLTGWLAATITALNAQLGGQHVCVVSFKRGESETVNAVRADSRVDIQRRRADREIAKYAKTVVVT